MIYLILWLILIILVSLEESRKDYLFFKERLKHARKLSRIQKDGIRKIWTTNGEGL